MTQAQDEGQKIEYYVCAEAFQESTIHYLVRNSDSSVTLVSIRHAHRILASDWWGATFCGLWLPFVLARRYNRSQLLLRPHLSANSYHQPPHNDAGHSTQLALGGRPSLFLEIIRGVALQQCKRQQFKEGWQLTFPLQYKKHALNISIQLGAVLTWFLETSSVQTGAATATATATAPTTLQQR